MDSVSCEYNWDEQWFLDLLPGIYNSTQMSKFNMNVWIVHKYCYFVQGWPMETFDIFYNHGTDPTYMVE